jgi:hypothetical protein
MMGKKQISMEIAYAYAVHEADRQVLRTKDQVTCPKHPTSLLCCHSLALLYFEAVDQSHFMQTHGVGACM